MFRKERIMFLYINIKNSYSNIQGIQIYYTLTYTKISLMHTLRRAGGTIQGLLCAYGKINQKNEFTQIISCCKEKNTYKDFNNNVLL